MQYDNLTPSNIILILMNLYVNKHKIIVFVSLCLVNRTCISPLKNVLFKDLCVFINRRNLFNDLRKIFIRKCNPLLLSDSN